MTGSISSPRQVEAMNPSPGSTQRVRAGAVGDGARDRVGDKAAACVQRSSRKQACRQSTARSESHPGGRAGDGHTVT